MRSRIGTVSVLSVGLVTALTIGATAMLVLQAHEDDLVDEIYWSADQLGAVIQRSTRDDMLGNRREALHRQIDAIGEQEGIGVVRVFNKEGRIVFSSDESEIGTAVDVRAEACDVCHAAGKPLERPPIDQRARIFEDAGAGRVLGVVRPIANEAGCWEGSCHAHGPEARVLGVLDVTVPLGGVDERLSASRTRLAGLAALAIGAGSLILWASNRRLVLHPVEQLAAATHRVAEGDLSTRVPVGGRHELGDLQRDFNRMVERLADARAQVTQADKLASVGRLAAGVAHEINNPLTGVLTFASVLARREELPDDARDDLRVIVRETKRCREIVRGMLDFARAMPARREPTDLNEVVRKATSILVKHLTLDRVDLKLELAPGLPRVSGDPNQLQQVVVNLLINAADAVAEGGHITARTGIEWIPAWGRQPLRGGRCPRGCDLMAPGVPASGHPSIRVIARTSAGERRVHLDALTGAVVGEGPGSPEENPDWLCPRCRASLVVETPCGRCGGPAFAVRIASGESVLWCCRPGCGWSRWNSEDERGQRPVAALGIEDDGQGIAPEDRARLFEPFFSTKGTHGTGLGLSVSWGLVEEHGGWIEVESAPGEGSRFTLRLPLPGGVEGEAQ